MKIIKHDNKILILLILVFFVLCLQTASAVDLDENNTIVSNSYSDGSFTDLQNLIKSNSEVNIYKDYNYYSYVDSNLKSGIDINKDTVINGNGHTINGNHQARIFSISNGTVTINNLNLINGNDPFYGGALILFSYEDCSVSNCILNNCNFRGNTAEYGGAIYIEDHIEDPGESEPYLKSADNIYDCYNCSIINCYFTDNTANFLGGAIYIVADNCSVTDCSFSGNTAEQGGSIYVASSYNCHVNHNTFNSNNAKSGKIIYSEYSIGLNCDYNYWGKNYDNKVDFVKADLINYEGMSIAPSICLNQKYSMGHLIFENNTIADDKSGIKLIVNDFIKYYHSKSQFEVKVLDKYNNPIANQKVIIYIDEVSYTRMTNSNGIAVLTINLHAGDYGAVVKLDNIELSKYVNIKVLSTISGNNIVKYFRNGTQYSAKFINSDGSPLTNTKVKFNIDGVFYEKTTNSNGVASMNINLRAGKFIITAIHPVNGQLYSNKITILPTLIANDLEMFYKDGSSFKIKAVDGKGNPLANKRITFNIDGIFYHKTTDNNGIAKLKINLRAGDFIITSTDGTFTTSNKIEIY